MTIDVNHEESLLALKGSILLKSFEFALVTKTSNVVSLLSALEWVHLSNYQTRIAKDPRETHVWNRMFA